LGGERFARKVRGRIVLDRESSGRRLLARRRTFAEIVGRVERIKGESWAAFRDRYGDWGRDAALWAARRHTGLTLREIGAAAGGMDSIAVALAIRRLAARAGRQRALRRTLAALDKQCKR
jgi:hypothetical protein